MHFSKSAAMLGNAEEHTALSRALSQLAETEERIEIIQRDQADHDFYLMTELLKDYISLLGSVKVIYIINLHCQKLSNSVSVILYRSIPVQKVEQKCVLGCPILGSILISWIVQSRQITKRSLKGMPDYG